jgi:hypothetical protein
LLVDSYQHIIMAQDVSIASDFSTNALPVNNFDMGSIQAVWTGATTTKAKVIPEASIDGVNWCAIFPDVAVKRMDSASGCLMYELTSLGYQYLRVRVDHQTNAGGTVVIHVFVKRRRANHP